MKASVFVSEPSRNSILGAEVGLAYAATPHVLALEHIRRMRGGAQPHLMRCSDGGYYVVKFLDNPQHPRVLANEWLGTRLAARLGLPTAQPAVVEVPEDLIERSDDLVIQLGRSQKKVRGGRQFGSRYPGDPAYTAVHDFLPDEPLAEVENLSDFLGMLAFDKWTCNTDGRQAVFYRSQGSSRYRALMTDQGFCFNAGEWNFPDAPLRGFYSRALVYQAVTGMDSFEPWLERLENRIGERMLDEIASEIPPDWYDFDQGTLYELIGRLWARRHLVRDLILAAKGSYRQPFPNWR